MDDDTVPRYSTKRLRQEVERETEYLNARIKEQNHEGHKEWNTVPTP